MTTETVVNLARVRALAASGEAKAIRINNRLSVAEIAETCDVDQTTVRRWEDGTRVPRGEAAQRYTRLLAALKAVA